MKCRLLMEGQRRSTPFRCVSRIDEDPFVNARPMPNVFNREDVLNDVTSNRKEAEMKSTDEVARVRLDDASENNDDESGITKSVIYFPRKS